MNGKVYVGKSITKKKKLYLGSGKLLRKAIKKYGEDAFMRRIMYYGKTNEELNEQEKFWIAKLRKEYGSDKLYNIADGGQNPIMFGENNHWFGKHDKRPELSKILKEGFKNGRVIWSKGKKLSAEHVAKQRETQIRNGKNKGENNPAWKEKITLVCLECSKEYKSIPAGAKRKYCSKICASKGFSKNHSGENNPLYGKPKSEEHKLAMRKPHKPHKRPNRKKKEL